MEQKKVLLIINPNAGKMKSKQTLYSIIDILSTGGLIVTVRITEYRLHATEIARDESKDYDMVVCSGGDGTLNEVINGIIQSGTEIPIGYIPSGSTNDFASTLGLSKDIEKATSDIIKARPYPIDIGKFDDRFFSYVASFGIFTKSSYATPQQMKNLLGSAAYILEGIKDITSVHDYHMTVNTGNNIIDDNFIFGAISNTTSLGGIVTLDPNDVALDDGMFEYLFVKRPRNLADLVKSIHAISSYDYESRYLYFGSASSLKIEWQDNLDWSLDGEHVSADNSAEVINLHRAIKILLPEKNDQIGGRYLL